MLNDTSGQPAAGIRVVAGPASSNDDIAYTPGGPTVKECVHGVPSGSGVLANGSVIFPNRTMITLPPCLMSTYTTNSTGWITISDITNMYYFFYAGDVASAFNSFGIVQMIQAEPTYLTIEAPSGGYTVTNTLTVVQPTCLLSPVVAPHCLQISVGPNPHVSGYKVTIDTVFRNTSNVTVNLNDYELYENVTDTHGNVVHNDFCVVAYEPALLAPGNTWECDDASWTLPAGIYYVNAYIYSISLQCVIASAEVTIP